LHLSLETPFGQNSIFKIFSKKIEAAATSREQPLILMTRKTKSYLQRMPVRHVGGSGTAQRLSGACREEPLLLFRSQRKLHPGSRGVRYPLVVFKQHRMRPCQHHRSHLSSHRLPRVFLLTNYPHLLEILQKAPNLSRETKKPL
jgi:hypothetical protein